MFDRGKKVERLSDFPEGSHYAILILDYRSGVTMTRYVVYSDQAQFEADKTEAGWFNRPAVEWVALEATLM